MRTRSIVRSCVALAAAGSWLAACSGIDGLPDQPIAARDSGADSAAPERDAAGSPADAGATPADAGSAADATIDATTDASTSADATVALDSGPCVPEGDVAFCTRLGKNCGTVTANDNCGARRTVASCGVCGSYYESCGGAGVPNACGCMPESDWSFCTRLGRTCGNVSGTDNCGNARAVASCGGSCAADAGTTVTDACIPETDSAICARLTATCGPLRAVDACGQLRVVASCGVCRGTETCGGGGVANACGCSGESDAALCAREPVSCGTRTAIDSCGQTRSIDCGACITPLSTSRISMGEEGVCVVVAGRRVWCAAANGLLAGINGDTLLLRGGGLENCRVASDGKLSCWRDNNAPTTILLSERALDVAVGYDFKCALLESGSVRCWGSDTYRQLGGSGQLPPTPAVPLPGPARAVVAGYDFACAVLTDGRLTCWGSNRSAVVDPSETCASACVRTPFVVPGTGRVVQAVAGSQFVCVLADDGAVRCWGGAPALTASSFQLLDRDVATPVSALGTSTKLGTGEGHVCAIGVDRRVRCWGIGAGTGSASLSTCGTTGLGTRCDFDVQTPVAGITDAIDLTTGHRTVSTCVLSADGSVRCFGRARDSGVTGTVCPWDGPSSYPECDVETATPISGVIGLPQ
jgi:hypothetical protein